MADWGDGMLQSHREYLVVGVYEEKFGLRELRAKICDKAGFKFENEPPFRLAMAAEYCFGKDSVDITRAYLDAGPLAEEFSTFLPLERLSGSNTGLRLVTLAASVMTLGCKIPGDIIKTLRQLVQCKDPALFRTQKARLQMEKAALTYVDGTAYTFGGTTLYESSLGGMLGGILGSTTTTTTKIGHMKPLKTVTANGQEIPQMIGPPTAEELEVTPAYPYDVCGGCGGDIAKANGGHKLLVCGKCKARKYCSKACQRRHWVAHKPICSRSKEEMEKFLDSIPLDFLCDAHPDIGHMFGHA